MGKNSEKNKVSPNFTLLCIYINLASSKEAFSAVTASLPSFVRSEQKVMAAVTGGDIRNAIAETKRKRRSTPEDPACRETKRSGLTLARS